MHFFIFLVLLVTASAVQADPTWTVIGTNQTLTAQVDTSSFKRLSDGTVQVWTRVKYRNIQHTKIGREYDQVDRLSVYNCNDRTRRPVQLIMYKGTHVVDSERVGEQIIPVLSGSFADIALNWACSQQVSLNTLPRSDYRR